MDTFKEVEYIKECTQNNVMQKGGGYMGVIPHV
jgi:hypothetical protein